MILRKINLKINIINDCTFCLAVDRKQLEDPGKNVLIYVLFCIFETFQEFNL